MLDYNAESLRGAVQVGAVLRRLVVRGERVTIFKFHFNDELIPAFHTTPLLPFPAYAVACIFQNDTVRRQLIANAI